MISLDDVVSLSRIQFGATAMFHFLFVPLTLGLSWILVIAESAYVMTGKVIYKDITRFWGKLFGINFVMGVTTGITLEFQFGTNWAYYSHYVGDIFGTPLAVEGLMAFFLESTLVGLFFFGWDKLSRGQHLLVTALVALGSNLSALWILIANGWMQNPVGAEFNPMTMRMELTDVAAVIFNPVAQVKFVHTVAAGYVAASLFVMGVSSWYLLRRMEVRFALRSFAIASGFGLAAILSVIVLGDESGYRSGEVQKVKLAAIEAEWHTEPAPASFTLFGLPDQGDETTHGAIKIPYLMGIIATRSLDEQVTGLKDLKAQHEVRIRSGMLAYDALEALRSDGSNAEARATFERHRADLGYGLLLTPHAKEIGKADESAIAKAVDDSIPQVAPPTITTPLTSSGERPASRRVFLIGRRVFSTSGRVISTKTCWSMTRSTSSPLSRLRRIGTDSSKLRRSLTSRAFISRRRESRSEGSEMPALSRIQQNRRWSKSSPPRAASPLVATTSKMPRESRSTEMSKVPPPRS